MPFRFLTLLIVSLLYINAGLWAHPMPNSVLLLDVKNNGVAAELQWPLKEFQLAFPGEDIEQHPGTLIERKKAWLENYLHRHISVTDATGAGWKVVIAGEKITQSEQDFTGQFSELVFNLWLQPPANANPRRFIIHYNAIMHQVVTHKMLIRIRQDWDGGLSEKDSLDADLGVLVVNPADGTVPPIIVNLDEGSKWKGFKNMIALGISHISEGTDHLLFLLVLMLPAPLVAAGGKWAKSGGAKYSILQLLKIATAFTIGHSLTLLAGAVGWLRLPSQPVEVLISVSILVGAIHALRPLFPGKELWIAAGFGLVHGLAFAATLAHLDVDGTRMALSILGFNIGIELMQLFVILLFVPWLIILAGYKIYKWVRITGALFALTASVAWIAERSTGRVNWVSPVVQNIAVHGQWIVLVLAVAALVCYFTIPKRTQQG